MPETAQQPNGPVLAANPDFGAISAGAAPKGAAINPD